jgi:hypothetical protein
MTDTKADHTNAETLDQDDPVDTADLLKQADKLARSSSDTVMKYIVMAVLTLFGALFFLQWKQNSSTPDRLIAILERNAEQTSASLKVQEASLAKIQEFSIRVPMEHAEASRKLDDSALCIGQMRTEQSELRAAVKANTEAVQANTQAVAELIEAMKSKMELLTPKNGQTPPN